MYRLLDKKNGPGLPPEPRPVYFYHSSYKSGLHCIRTVSQSPLSILRPYSCPVRQSCKQPAVIHIHCRIFGGFLLIKANTNA